MHLGGLAKSRLFGLKLKWSKPKENEIRHRTRGVRKRFADTRAKKYLLQQPGLEIRIQKPIQTSGPRPPIQTTTAPLTALLRCQIAQQPAIGGVGAHSHHLKIASESDGGGDGETAASQTNSSHLVFFQDKSHVSFHAAFWFLSSHASKLSNK